MIIYQRTKSAPRSEEPPDDEGPVEVLMGYVGRRVSSRTAGDFPRSSGLKVSNDTVEDCAGYLTDSFLLARAERIDSRAMERMRTRDKFYACDPGIRNSVSEARPEDLEGVLENLVYNELVFRYGSTYTCDVDGLEVDFVVNPDGRARHCQVCLSLKDPKTLKRELAPLRALDDDYPRTVITCEDFMLDDIDGMRIVRIADRLLGTDRAAFPHLALPRSAPGAPRAPARRRGPSPHLLNTCDCYGEAWPVPRQRAR